MLTPQLNPRVLAAQLTAELVEFRAIGDDFTGGELDVRVVVDLGDETWWLATGDVQYDTVHGDICAAGTLTTSMCSSEILELAKELCDEVDSAAAEFTALGETA